MTPFEKKPEDLEVFYGLQGTCNFVKNATCQISNPCHQMSMHIQVSRKKQRWHLIKDGICHACNFNLLKENGEIDWDQRERELIDLCDQFRRNDGRYDCIVGGSGGKDGAMQSHFIEI